MEIRLSPPQRFFPRLRVFHAAVRYGKRHVKLIETSTEERKLGIKYFRLLMKTVCGPVAIPRKIVEKGGFFRTLYLIHRLCLWGSSG
jgi:hypothetical protein